MPTNSQTEGDDPLRFASAVGFGATLGGQGLKIKGAYWSIEPSSGASNCEVILRYDVAANEVVGAAVTSPYLPSILSRVSISL